MKRGDVILVRIPHASGIRGKKRPAVVLQSDAFAGAVQTIVAAGVATNLTMLTTRLFFYRRELARRPSHRCLQRFRGFLSDPCYR